jgi:hypothetical protein
MGSTGTAGATVFNLPASYRPSVELQFITASPTRNTFSIVSITAAGDVIAGLAAIIDCGFDGITFDTRA